MHTEIQSQDSQQQDLQAQRLQPKDLQSKDPQSKDPQSKDPQSNSESAADAVLRIARNLHRAAYSESKVVSLPILRRLLATATLTAISLPELHRSRDIIQRKHILRMLAVEVGFKCWEDYRHELDNMNADQLAHFDHVRRTAGYPNLWFSSYEDAREYTRENNGHAVRIGTQAVVLVG